MSFADRVAALPSLGIGVSTEYQAMAKAGALDPRELRHLHPEFAGFLEVGVEASRGVDAQAEAWSAAGWPTTYHFLDVNLDEPEDLDAEWLAQTRANVETLNAAWICGDAGLWHFGPRERGQMLLLPPILTDEAARAMADGIIALREATGREVLPENPPGHVFIGDLHLLEFYARLCEYADTGMLLDAAHLAIYQHCQGNSALDGLSNFPLDRIVEVHVAGAVTKDVDGLTIIEDDHTPNVLPATWQILRHVAPRASELRAVVFECEHNPIDVCLPGFRQIQATLADSPFAKRAAQAASQGSTNRTITR
ncbi:MAG: hypothetical protein ACI9U2_001623 [Bradymonadia bacterium]|jgi:uncharacterized protein (UPF0276 family)